MTTKSCHFLVLRKIPQLSLFGSPPVLSPQVTFHFLSLSVFLTHVSAHLSCFTWFAACVVLCFWFALSFLFVSLYTCLLFRIFSFICIKVCFLFCLLAASVCLAFKSIVAEVWTSWRWRDEVWKHTKKASGKWHARRLKQEMTDRKPKLLHHEPLNGLALDLCQVFMSTPGW